MKEKKVELQLESISVVDAVTIGTTPEYYIKNKLEKNGKSCEIIFDQSKSFVEVHIETHVILIPLANIKSISYRK